MGRGNSPNIILITIEHLSVRGLGCYGNTIARTPHLDELAAAGTRFEHCTVPSPLCVPSRVSFFTGRYPSITGCRDNTLLMPEKETGHLPGLLKEAGYVCGLFGKDHCFPDAKAAGFQEVHNETGVRLALREEFGRPWPEPPKAIDPNVLAAQVRRFRWGEYPRPIWYGGSYPVEAARTPARLNADRALDFLKRHRAEPTFTWLSFSDPHPPYRSPEPYCSMYRPEDMPLPERPPQELQSKPFVQQVYYHGGWMRLMDDEQLRQALAFYYGSLSFVDACVGVLIEGLKREGIWDDTVIIATGDHGDYLGEHGLIRKTANFYDCLVQVPLIARGLPGTAPGQTSFLQTEQIDLYPALLQAAGIGIPAGVQGRSITDVLAGRLPARESTYAEVGSRQPRPPGGAKAELDALKAGINREEALEALPLVESGTFFLSSGRMIRTDSWKYAHYVDDRPELYDLDMDPLELQNLAGREEYREKEEELRRALLERTIEAGDPRSV